MKQISQIIVVLLSLALLCMSNASAKSNYQSITEIRQNTPPRWQETYETTWRTVTVDTPIEIPDVEQFPIIRIVLHDAVADKQLSAYDKIMQNCKGNLEARLGPPTHVILNNEWTKFPGVSFHNGEVPDIQPENNPLPYDEALAIITDECTRLFGDVQLSLQDTTIMSRVYRYKNVNGKREWLDPVTEKGQYFIILGQTFHGIDYEASIECYDILGLSHESYMAEPYACFSFYDANSYSFYITFRQELDEIEADVPILPFFDAKAAIEKEITAGYLRSVDEVKLCYAPYYDPADDSILWLLPVWYVKGAYSHDRNREFQPWINQSTGEVLDTGIEYREIVFQAQLGSLLDYNDSRASRRKVPRIISWDTVNQ